MQKDYQEGSLREKLYGKGPKLSKPHPAALHRQALLDAGGGTDRGVPGSHPAASASVAK
jgi:hypothetical protein